MNIQGIVVTLVAVVLCHFLSGAYQPYQKKIPNGDRVPNPCRKGKIMFFLMQKEGLMFK